MTEVVHREGDVEVLSGEPESVRGGLVVPPEPYEATLARLARAHPGLPVRRPFLDAVTADREIEDRARKRAVALQKKIRKARSTPWRGGRWKASVCKPEWDPRVSIVVTWLGDESGGDPLPPQRVRY